MGNAPKNDARVPQDYANQEGKWSVIKLANFLDQKGVILRRRVYQDRGLFYSKGHPPKRKPMLGTTLSYLNPYLNRKREI